MRISSLRLIGIALIVLGIVAAYYGTPYTSGENVFPLRASVDTKKTIPLSPLLVGFVLVGGAVLVAVGTTKSS
jgi:uncharacterized membrane protein